MTQNDQPTEGSQPIAPTSESTTPHVPPVPEQLGEPKVETPALDEHDAAQSDDGSHDDLPSLTSPYADHADSDPYAALGGLGGGMPGGMPDMGGFDLSGLMAQAQAMQSQLQTAQDELAKTTMTGTAGGGLVTATMTGAGEITGLTIKPEAVDPEDTETLADLVIAAIRDAQGQLAAIAQAKMGPITGGMPDLGGFGF